jgi:hypothetical protein
MGAYRFCIQCRLIVFRLPVWSGFPFSTNPFRAHQNSILWYFIKGKLSMILCPTGKWYRYVPIILYLFDTFKAPFFTYFLYLRNSSFLLYVFSFSRSAHVPILPPNLFSRYTLLSICVISGADSWSSELHCFVALDHYLFCFCCCSRSIPLAVFHASA